jgi:hypothetical protein
MAPTTHAELVLQGEDFRQNPVVPLGPKMGVALSIDKVCCDSNSVFQVSGVDADGPVVIQKRIGRVKVLEFFAVLPAIDTGRWCHGGHLLCTRARHEAALARSSAGAQTGQGRSRCTRQQDCTCIPRCDDNGTVI